jgi:hypothetical protein
MSFERLVTVALNGADARDAPFSRIVPLPVPDKDIKGPVYVIFKI